MPNGSTTHNLSVDGPMVQLGVMAIVATLLVPHSPPHTPTHLPMVVDRRGFLDRWDGPAYSPSRHEYVANDRSAGGAGAGDRNMLTRSGQYALRAVIYLAQHPDDWPIPGRVIAAKAKIPSKYLSKILGDLVRAGLLESNRGKAGGFAMRKAAAKMRLIEILSPFEPLESRECPFGNTVCSDAHPCLAHDRWKRVVEAEQKFLHTTSVKDIAEPSRS